MATVVINTEFLHIRKITEHDVKESDYNNMNVLPRKTIEMLTVLTSAEVEEELKDKRIF